MEQIEELSSQLAAKVAVANQNVEKAALFLASRGYDATVVGNELRKVSDIIPGPASPTIALDIDADGFLQSELDSIVLGTLERVDRLAVERAESIIEERQENSWESIKRAVNEKRVLPCQGVVGTAVGPKVAAYAKVINIFNDARLKGSSINLSRAFEDELRALDGIDPRSEILLDCWRVLQSVLGTNGSESDNVFEIKDLSSSYLADPRSVEGKVWKNQLIKGSLAFLEDVYVRFVDRTLTQYPRDALLGGRPSAMERVRAFCEIKLKRMSPAELANVEIVNGSAIWLLLYTLVRCGLLKDALFMAQSLEHVMQRSDEQFFAFFKAFVTCDGHQLSSQLLGQLRLEYGERVAAHPPQDPYKMALLKVMGRCDLARKSVSGVIMTSEDYLWLQFWLIQDGESGEDGGAYTLSDLQRIVTDFGPRHFDPKGGNPWHYFEVLSLVGLFERGIEYLHAQGQYPDALHFALALSQAGTIRYSSSESALFTKQNGFTAINFASLVTTYAAALGQSDLLEAVNYLLLLTIAERTDYDSICQKAICELVLQSGEYGTLLGDVRADGSVSPGTLAQYAPLMKLPDTSSFMEKITAQAAGKCALEGRFREALQLYNLSGQYEKVVELLCTRLGRLFAAPYVALECDEWRRTADSVLNYYSAQSHISTILSSAARNTCHMLIQLLSVRKAFEDMQWSYALDLLLNIRLIPLEGDVAEVSTAADRVKDMSDTVALILPDLLLITMTVVVRRAMELRSFIGVDAGRVQQFELLRRMGRNLMTFVGMLGLRIPQETCAQLTKMEISLN
jgi:nuclear pore complex protein Nup93